MKIKLAYFLVLTGVFIAALVINLALFQRIYRTDPADITIRIKRGDNLRSVADELENKQVIFSKLFLFYRGEY